MNTTATSIIFSDQRKLWDPYKRYAGLCFEPLFSRAQFELHLKLHQNYYNALVEYIEKNNILYETFDQLAPQLSTVLQHKLHQYWYHCIFWESLKTTNAPSQSSPLLSKMLEFYGGLDTLLHKIQKVAMSHFGSGWCVVGFQNDNLSAKPSELLYTEILPRNFSNADLAAKVNFQPLLVVDLWEHSYLLDYKTNKAQYYKRFCSQIDWTRVSLRLQKYLYSSNIKTYRKVKLFHPDARTPSKKYLTDAGWDCYNIEDFTLKPRESKRIPLGIGLQVRNGEYVSVNTRSSIKLKGASALDSVCDAGYTGELYGYIINNTDKQLLFKKGERVFQIVISKIPYIEYLSEGELPESERGTNGFGSTGL